MVAITDSPDLPMRCANPDCRVEETGRCVDGLELEDCSFFGESPDDNIEAELDQGSAEPSRPSVRLRLAGKLNLRQASAVLRAGPARLVAIIGPSDAGKTSLIAGLYDLFQRGEVNGVGFARSQTLHAFEAACHDARSASRRVEPHINRTPIGEVTFYHLEVAGGSAGAGVSMLLGDRAGEEYREAANDYSVAEDFHEVHRADTVTMLVDGDRLLGVGRHNVSSDVIMILEGLIAGEALGSKPRFALVLTKLDVVVGSPLADRVERDFDALFQVVSNRFGHAFQRIGSFRVAASPKSNVTARGAGVADLFEYWLGLAEPPAHKVEPPRGSVRMFGNLRVPTELDEAPK